MSAGVWFCICRLEARGVDIRDASPAHLVYFHPERDLHPIILANCNYSLEVGKGSHIEYDLRTMEKQVEERFIWGRPRLQFQVCVLRSCCLICSLWFGAGISD